MSKRMPTLKIGDLEAYPPIIQGGMGIRVSRSGLASAVANEGGIGIIAGVGLGKYEDWPGKEFIKVNDDAFREEIRKARKMTNGILGVNLMVVLSNYQSLTRVAVEEEVDLIISGAGLPLDLPELIKGKDIKLAPIVSSARAFSIICKKWKRHHNKLPDAVVVEGLMAGGHIGFSYEDILNETAPTLDKILLEVIEVAKSFDKQIPVIAAGGIFDGKDIARVLKLGASGVQMGTRFVCTNECDVHEKFKQAYLNVRKEDIVIIKSPVGMPGRVIRSKFVDEVAKGEKTPFVCKFHCLKSCDPKTAPFCIAKALANAAEGNLDEGFVFAGSNAYKCNEIVSVKDLMSQLVKEAEENL
ncbi:MAG: nitronate monooxygenase family protein [Patescibacteria group bacterium]